MGLYGGSKVTYNPPPPDNTFSKILEYQQASDQRLQDRAEQERNEAKAEAAARKASGAAAYPGLKTTTQQQLAQGLIGYESAANQLRDYAARYDLTPPEADIAELTQQYTAALPGKRATGIQAAHEELYGRPATAEELSKAQDRFQQGYYTSMEDFKSSLTKSPEYQKKFNQSYLDNYYDTMFGKQTADEKGEKTGKRAFKFDSKLLPSYGGNLADRTKITTPDFGEGFEGTPAELEAQQQNVRDTRQYLYSAGLTNLQGEIDTNIQKLKKESAKEVATIGSTGNVYSNLVSGFWS
jgi:hypothetical protein